MGSSTAASAGEAFGGLDENAENMRSISNEVAERLCLPRQTAYEVVCCVFSIMEGALRAGSRISIRNFGSFETRSAPPRRIYIPAQNNFVWSEPKKSIKFSSKLKF